VEIGREIVSSDSPAISCHRFGEGKMRITTAEKELSLVPFRISAATYSLPTFWKWNSRYALRSVG
jgi:hypothetical protein